MTDRGIIQINENSHLEFLTTISWAGVMDEIKTGGNARHTTLTKVYAAFRDWCEDTLNHYGLSESEVRVVKNYGNDTLEIWKIVKTDPVESMSHDELKEAYRELQYRMESLEK